MNKRNTSLRFALGLAVTFTALQATLSVAETTNNPPPAKTNTVEADRLRQLFTTCFRNWHHSLDGMLSLGEVNAVIENPQARGDEAAAAVVIHRFIENPHKEGGTKGVTLEQLMRFTQAPRALVNFLRAHNEIQDIDRTVNRTLFVGNDPSLDFFRQGGMGDCYFLSAVGALVARDGTAVRYMFSSSGAGWQVRFRNGKEAFVPYLTDGELVLGARASTNHGIWLDVLEKAYATLVLNEAHRGTAVTADVIGRGGLQGPAISLLTGHRAALMRLFKKGGEDEDKAIERARKLLTTLSREKRLMGVGRYAPPGSKPDGIPIKHAFGVLGYDAAKQMVTVFDPRGLHFTPRGAPGMIYGYATYRGVFEVPLREFIHLFTELHYETAVPL